MAVMTAINLERHPRETTFFIDRDIPSMLCDCTHVHIHSYEGIKQFR